MKYNRESSFYGNYTLYYPHPKLIFDLGLKIRRDKSYIWEDENGNEIIANTLLNYNTSFNNVVIADKNNFFNLISKTDISIIFSVSVEKRLLACDIHSNLPYYHWMYYLTLYELCPDGNINEISHYSLKR